MGMSTDKNELYDGTTYQSLWVLGQPTFELDSFDCNDPILQNQEFTDNLDEWVIFDAIKTIGIAHNMGLQVDAETAHIMMNPGKNFKEEVREIDRLQSER